jgi:hypothetical protein
VNGLILLLPILEVHTLLTKYKLEDADHNRLIAEITRLKSQAEQQGECDLIDLIESKTSILHKINTDSH